MAAAQEQPRAPAGTANGGQWISFTHASPQELRQRHMLPHEKELNDLRYDKELKKWVSPDGKPVSAETEARLKAAGAKPGYQRVALNPDPSAALQARGIDAKGRTQYMYSRQHSEAAAAEKFARLRDFNEALPGIRARLDVAVSDESLTMEQRDAAAALSLIERTGIRIGSDRETGGSEKAYGASTLLGRHVRLGDGGRVELEFVGKHGATNRRAFEDQALHDYLATRVRGQEDRVFATDDAAVRAQMKRVAGPDFSPKDFRTWHGTSVALREVAKHPVPSSAREEQRVRSAVAKAVSDHLSNTPAVALSAYIDPAVFQKWGRP